MREPCLADGDELQLSLQLRALRNAFLRGCEAICTGHTRLKAAGKTACSSQGRSEEHNAI